MDDGMTLVSTTDSAAIVEAAVENRAEDAGPPVPGTRVPEPYEAPKAVGVDVVEDDNSSRNQMLAVLEQHEADLDQLEAGAQLVLTNEAPRGMIPVEDGSQP